jgi:TatD DNase family protein
MIPSSPSDPSLPTTRSQSTIELIDTHTHLDSPEFDADRAECVRRAQEAGIVRILTIGAADGLGSAKRAIALAREFPCVWAATGIHPHDAARPESPDELRELAQDQRVVAIGETGLDFFRDWSPKRDQYIWFERQIGLALELKKPLVIHSREAGKECLEVLKQNGASEVGGVFHCYAENANFAEKLREINFLVSFPGFITFKRSDDSRAIARDIPLEQMMIETDAPYMAPEPHRGKRCEVAHVRGTAEVIAQIKDLPLDEFARVTTINAMKLFWRSG